MIAPGNDLRAEVESYLGRLGWTRGAPGVAGDLWASAIADAPRLAVPFHINPDSREFNALTHRLALEDRRSAAEVSDDIENEFQDVQSYRISDAFAQDDSVLLESAATVLQSARRLLRAASTTARKPRASIDSNFSKPADEIADRARLSHTRKGSFVLPIVMPIRPPDVLPNHLLGAGDDVYLEPSERRVTRTLASAIAALDAVAVRPAKEPGAGDLHRLVEVGVSRELVGAVRAIATEAGVHAFESSFRWAGGAPAPGGVPARVIIPSDADDLLKRVEARLKFSKPRAEESVSGQIVQIRQIPGEPTGEVTVRAMRGGRSIEVHIVTTSTTTRDATDWFKAGRAVLAHGRLLARPGRPLSMPSPMSVLPLDQIFLDAFRGDQLLPNT